MRLRPRILVRHGCGGEENGRKAEPEGVDKRRQRSRIPLMLLVILKQRKKKEQRKKTAPCGPCGPCGFVHCADQGSLVGGQSEPCAFVRLCAMYCTLQSATCHFAQVRSYLYA